MFWLYVVFFFILGMILGSFYNVVGLRLPDRKSIVYPSSHCPKCNHKLTGLELIPIFSYLFLHGKCKNCKNKISIIYPLFELFTASMFALSYAVFGLSIDLAISLIFISALDIIIVSDIRYMIIPDEVLVLSGFLIIICLLLKDFNSFFNGILSGIVAFIVMFLIKKLGDLLFKKESLGGGDIKLMFIIGLVLPMPINILAIFVACFIALPIALINLLINKDHMIPFGPYLSIAALVLFFFQISANDLLTWFT